jgi:hypothetical protein
MSIQNGELATWLGNSRCVSTSYYMLYWANDLEQSQVAPGATVLGTILSLDKTNISAMTGGRIAHPLLISLANVDMSFRMKASNHIFLLLALLPVPKFIHKN